MSFFNSKKANHLPNKLLIQSIPYSLDLIKLLAPQKIVFLGGGGMLEKLNRVNRTKIFDINYEMTAPGIYKGQFNGFPFLAVPHPSAYLTSEYRQTVVDNITAFMN
jgi:uracil-DNA glycosylase